MKIKEPPGGPGGKEKQNVYFDCLFKGVAGCLATYIYEPYLAVNIAAKGTIACQLSVAYVSQPGSMQ